MSDLHAAIMNLPIDRNKMCDWSDIDAYMQGFKDARHAAAELAALAPAVPQVLTWHEGSPPFPQDQEWFIAETTYGDRVVLRSMDEGREHKGNYAFKTADGTYMKSEVVRRWMQFPDCEYLPPAVTSAPAVPPGWQLVPMEPTPEMCAAAVRFANGDAVYKNVVADALKIEEGIYGEVYAAMVAAAPSAPATSSAQPEPEMTDCPHGVPHRWSCGECDAPSAKETQT